MLYVYYSQVACQRLNVYDGAVGQNILRDAVARHVILLILKRRKEQGLSMAVVAQRSGLSQGMVSLVERGLRNPSLETLLRLEEALEMDLADVLKAAKKSALAEVK